MKFHVEKVLLWLNNGNIREIEFKPNKVNVITGDSSTGKTEILNIIDYCFFSSESKISESIVNENTSWYGILFNINDKRFTVARKSINEGKTSEDYYFSSDAEIPEEISSNTTVKVIKSILETEFSIDSNVAIPYGSNLIKLGSKISLRYFLMFNTISVNIIENDTGVFFDKQNIARYRDALPRIFDLAVGIETIENILKKEKKADLKQKLLKLEKKSQSISNKSDEFKSEQKLLIKEAKEYSLIDTNLDFDSSLTNLKSVVSGIDSSFENTNDNDQTESKIYLIERKISNLKRFTKEYASYKRNLNSTLDSLKPISFLKEMDKDIIKTSIFDDVINLFDSELKQIKNACKVKTPIDKQVNDEIKLLEKELVNLREIKSTLPQVSKNFENDKSKYFFLGEVKSKMDLYSSSKNHLSLTTSDEIEELEQTIESIKVINTNEKRELTVKLIEEIISEYIDTADTALENYAKYRPVFDYSDKKLLLRKPKTSFIEPVGSSSNHLFLQLFFTLAMQEAAFQNKSPFVAPYIIIDQPSRPYYGSGEKRKKNIDHSDEAKITKVFELLNNFIETRINNSSDFQMIVFEHVPSEIFKGFKHVHLVEEFYDGNALIPSDVID
jgi:hypothetical protein